jgi:hypothetical protein
LKPYQKSVSIFCYKSYLIHTPQLFVVKNKKVRPWLSHLLAPPPHTLLAPVEVPDEDAFVAGVDL